MKKIFLITFFLILTKNSLASIKDNIITKLTEVENFLKEVSQFYLIRKFKQLSVMINFFRFLMIFYDTKILNEKTGK